MATQFATVGQDPAGLLVARYKAAATARRGVRNAGRRDRRAAKNKTPPAELATVAVLYVQRRGAYAGLANVDLWDEKRDARKYAGPYPVVAHPPCARWCRLAGLVEKRWGHLKGDDGGTFAAALEAVRKFGGVLEHPAYSDAWTAFELPIPSAGGWQRGLCGGWTCHVEQGRYGHAAKKATWLYAFGVLPPPLRWGIKQDRRHALVSFCGNKLGSAEENDPRPRLTKKGASSTPIEFRDLLLSIARESRRLNP